MVALLVFFAGLVVGFVFGRITARQHPRPPESLMWSPTGMDPILGEYR